MQPFFLDGAKGRLFAVYHPPAPGRLPLADLLCVPPFAEEMNRSRRMTKALALRLADIGCGALIVDLFGTGDSAGDFEDARLDTWRDDVQRAFQWLAARGAPHRFVLGVRFGALLALDALTPYLGGLTGVALWNPIVNDEQLLTQFLRVSALGEGSTTAELRQRLARGQRIDVAGFTLSPGLAADLDAMTLDPARAAATGRLGWFDVTPDPNRPPPPATRRLIEQIGTLGGRIDYQPVQGEPFWGLMEPPLVPTLIGATVATIERAVS